MDGQPSARPNAIALPLMGECWEHSESG
jgi:hypothetical protein